MPIIVSICLQPYPILLCKQVISTSKGDLEIIPTVSRVGGGGGG